MNCRVHKFKLSRRQLNILLGYNLPFVLWFLFAGADALLGFQAGWKCPVHSWLGWCPGCGLTRAFSLFLTGQDCSNPWFILILAGFLLNFLWSIRKANILTLSPRDDGKKRG